MSDWKEIFDWSKTAVIVVDMQNDFCHVDGSGSLNGGDVTKHYAIVPNIQRVIDAAHGAGRPVVFIKTTHDASTNSPAWLSRRRERKHDTCVTGTWGTEYFGVAPIEGDVEVIKHRYSAFIGTDLDLKLRSMGVEALIFTGVGTNVCVESSIRDGFMLDYYVTLLKDCTAAGDDLAYNSTLTTIGRSWGWISDSEEVSGLLAALPQTESALVTA
jgi:ureidoacrylate peracid hydrolase